MKKIFYLAFIVVMASACHKAATSYKITGKFEGNKFDTATVFIKERVEHSWINLDSVKVADGKFEFSGKADSAKICYLDATDKDGNRFRQSFILENGNIIVNVDTTGYARISGTRQNAILSNFNIEAGAKEYEMTSYYNSQKEKYKDNWDSVKDSIEQKTGELQTKINHFELEEAIKYVNKPAGNQMFMSSFYNFTVKEKEALFSKMDAKTKAIPRIAELIAATEIEKKTSEGAHYVNFTMPDMNGNLVSLSDLVGKTDYLLVDFWASWCPDCRASLPGLKEFYEKNRGEHFDILGVSFDKNKEKWMEGVEKFALPWTNVSDLKFWDCEAGKLYAVNAIPTTVLIDKSGTIVGRILELKNIQDLLNQIVTK